MHKHLVCFFWTMLVARTKLKLRSKMTERFSHFWLQQITKRDWISNLASIDHAVQVMQCRLSQMSQDLTLCNVLQL